MLYLVVEQFKDAGAIRERMLRDGRMMPEGLLFKASWITAEGRTCFQLMETDDPTLFDLWTERWQDLMEFEIRPVMPSADYWATRG